MSLSGTEEFMVCTSCGFVIKKSGLKEVCPACGVPAKMFAPYVERVSQVRRLLLKLDLHPVMVHFPQAFTVTLMLLSIAGLLLSGVWHERVLGTLQILGLLLPLTVALAFAAGLFDGKIRFRRVGTPLLIRKMIVAGLFFVCSLAVAGVVSSAGFGGSGSLFLVLLFSGLGLGCGTVLALWGVTLLGAKFPG